MGVTHWELTYYEASCVLLMKNLIQPQNRRKSVLKTPQKQAVFVLTVFLSLHTCCRERGMPECTA